MFSSTDDELVSGHEEEMMGSGAQEDETTGSGEQEEETTGSGEHEDETTGGIGSGSHDELTVLMTTTSSVSHEALHSTGGCSETHDEEGTGTGTS